MKHFTFYKFICVLFCKVVLWLTVNRKCLEDRLDDFQVHRAGVSMLTLGNILLYLAVLSCGQELVRPQSGLLVIDQTQDALQLGVVVPWLVTMLDRLQLSL